MNKNEQEHNYAKKDLCIFCLVPWLISSIVL